MNKEKYIELKGIATDGYDDTGEPITIIQIEGDPLNLLASAESIEIDMYISKSNIQPETKVNSYDDSSDAAIAKRKWAVADGTHIGLNCSLLNATCIGPDCDRFAGIEYDRHLLQCSFLAYRK